MYSDWYHVCKLRRPIKVPAYYGLPSYSATQLLDFHCLDRIPTEDDLGIAHWLIGEAGIDLVDGIQGVFLEALEHKGSMDDRKFVSLLEDFTRRFKDLGEDKWKEYTYSESEPLRKVICKKLLKRDSA